MKKKLDYRAKLVVHEANKLTHKQVQELTKWLRNLSYEIDDNWDQFSTRFTARLMK